MGRSGWLRVGSGESEARLGVHGQKRQGNKEVVHGVICLVELISTVVHVFAYTLRLLDQRIKLLICSIYGGFVCLLLSLYGKNIGSLDEVHSAPS